MLKATVSANNVACMLVISWLFLPLAGIISTIIRRWLSNYDVGKQNKSIYFVVSALNRFLLAMTTTPLLVALSDGSRWTPGYRFMFDDHTMLYVCMSAALYASLMLYEMLYIGRLNLPTVIHHVAAMLMTMVPVICSYVCLHEVTIGYFVLLAAQSVTHSALLYTQLGRNKVAKCYVTLSVALFTAVDFLLANAWFAYFFYCAWRNISLTNKLFYGSTIIGTAVDQVHYVAYLYNKAWTYATALSHHGD